MNNGTIEQISPLGWAEVERSKEADTELTLSFEFKGYPASLKLRGGSLDQVVMKLPATIERLEGLGAIPLRREGVVVPRSGSKVKPAVLGKKEYEILVRTVNGQKGPRIAQEMGIAKQTVTSHIAHIKVKLGIESRLGLRWWAQENGLLENDK